MRTQFRMIIVLLAGASALTLAGRVLADTTNVWTAGSGNFTNAANWDAGTVPTPAIGAFFTNAGTYTVTFTSSVTNETVHVGSPSNQAANVTFDMNGNQWRNVTPTVGVIGFFNQAGETGTVTFSSSASPIGAKGNNVELRAGDSVGGDYQFGRGGTMPGVQFSVMNINTNLGFGVTVHAFSVPYYFDAGAMTINIDGPGSALINDLSHAGGMAADLNVTRSGLWRDGGVSSTSFTPTGRDNTWTISDARVETTRTDFFHIGWGYSTTIRLISNAVWNASAPLGVDDSYRFYTVAPWGGDLLVDSSTLNGQSLQIGSSSDIGQNGRVTIQNGSTVTLSNGLFTVYFGRNPATPFANTNALVLNNSTIRLGSGAVSGWLTNRSLMSAGGTITGLGASPALVRNERRLDVGNSIGTLTLNNARLELAAGSQTYFEFSDTGRDQIIGNRSASLLGSNIFSLVAGSPAPVPGVKYGLGVYDFVIGTNINNSPQYDNLVNLLTNTYHLTYGVDFQYGVVNLGNGLFALELAFVPEPSTVMLLALGGLLAWRRVAKRGKAVAK